MCVKTSLSKRLAFFSDAFSEAIGHVPSHVSIPTLTGSASAFAAASLVMRPRDCPLVLAITPGVPQQETLYEDLCVLSREATFAVHEFPPSLDDDLAAHAARLKVVDCVDLFRTHPSPLVITASVPALLSPVPQASAVREATLRLSLQDACSLSFATLQARLVSAGFERAPEVVAVGQYAVRGGVLDVWPPGEIQAVRIEYFGDELDSLRRFDPATQISTAKISSIEISPCTLQASGADASQSPSATLLSLLPAGATVLWLDAMSCPAELLTVPSAALCIYAGLPPEAQSSLPHAQCVPYEVPFLTTPLPGFAEMRASRTAMHDTLLVDRVRVRLATHLATARKRGALVLEDDELSGGFELPGLVIATKSDRMLSSAARTHHLKTHVNMGERLTDIQDLEPGDLVVHVDYGIGRFEGSTEVEVGSHRSEVFTIAYADGARVHVPVSHVHLLSRYVGVRGEQVKLHRLDGKRWTREKSDACHAVQDLASSLLERAARRAVVPGFAYETDVPGLDAFVAAFPYELTRDQSLAIAAVRRDMASAKPMDRLVCGDAGYGKTEVALRAAFIAAMNGKQVALLAPTTILAEQHYETFLARFENTPLRVETLSRFVTDSARQGIRTRIASGAADIVIGTHAILSKKILFHDLGLIIIDEEQRFGVRHKEHLKSLRATADVLTLSATPIPRTLYLSMTGVRDLSLLRTPPRERTAVETKIIRDRDAPVQEALERELARGGQVYYLYNRVATIERAFRRVRALAPKARIAVAHAQMSTEELAEKMRAFVKGDTDILICTTIVESGLDVPRANTMFVDRADRFGLAELYQLRGRVGRSARTGYAYFLLPEEGLVDADARERLEALRKYGGLGAGFNVAMRDLEIRGAGNLLGREQSGHVAAVGFQLYCQLLQRTIACLKGEKVPDIVDVSVNVDFLDFSPGGPAAVSADAGACLPYSYVEDEVQRMEFHKRLAETTTLEDVKRVKVELADRYGRLPKCVVRLIKLTEFRVRCRNKGIARVDVSRGRAVFKRGTDVVKSVPCDGRTADEKLATLFNILMAL